MKVVNRRDFLKATGAAAGAAALSGCAAGRKPFAIVNPPKRGPNETIRVAVVGINGRGWSHIYGFDGLEGFSEGVKNVEVAALCDVDGNVLKKQLVEFKRRKGRKIAGCKDMRELLDDKSIDVISIATPNHWHSLGAIWAIQAGKDVYVEKPCSHNVWEGRQLVKAARKYKRMVQHGTQGRTSVAIREAIAKLREGIIGEVYMAKGMCYKLRTSIGKTPDEPVPAGVDYDAWLGPAPERAFSRNRFHYNWHWHWDYGNGDLGNQGVHEMDIARWGLGVGMPSKIQSMGGQFLMDDDKEVPNTQIASFSYPEQNKILNFEVRHWISNHEGAMGKKASNNVGVIFYGSEGYMTVGYFKYATFLGKKREPGPAKIAQLVRAGKRTGDDSYPWTSFIDAVRSRKVEDLGVDIEEGHLTSATCHLAHVSYRLGRTIDFDPKTERCIGDPEANRMLTRNYRKPYVVPKTV